MIGVRELEEQAGAELGQAQISYQLDTLALKFCWEFMQLLWSIGKGYSLLIKSSKSSKCEQINITKTSLTKQIVSDQFKFVQSI